MIFLDGREFTGKPPGLRTAQRGPVDARLPDRRPRRTRGHHPGELDRLTQTATEAPRQRRWPLCGCMQVTKSRLWCRAISRSLPGVMWLRLAVAGQGSPMRGSTGRCSLIYFPSHFRITRRWPSLFRNDGCYHAINNPERRPSGVILSFRPRPVKSGRLPCRE